MLPSAQTPWVALRWRQRRDRLWLTYEDSAGIQITPPRGAFATEDWHSVSIAEFLDSPVLVPRSLGEHLHDRLREFLEQHINNSDTDQVPLGVFIQSRPTLPEADGERVAAEILRRDIVPQWFQPVRLPARPWIRRTPFRLPFRILAMGPNGAAAVDALRNVSWLQGETVQKYGFQIDLRSRDELLSTALRRTPYDIVIAEGDEGGRLLRLLAHGMSRGEQRPRLLVLLGAGALETSVPLPTGVSLLRVPGDATSGWTVEFVLGLVHDQPLHEAVNSAQRKRGRDLNGEPVLVADPASNQALRMADARHELREELTRLRIQTASFSWPMWEAGGKIPSDTRLFLQSAIHEEESAVSAAEGASRYAAFDRETSGLHPMANAEAALERGRAVISELRATIAHETVPAVVEDRRVDVAMEQPVVSGVYEPVSPGKPLDPGGSYRLRVHVGMPLPESLVVGDVPLIDGLLPAPDDERGHELEVVVFPKTFRLLSAAVQPLRLPLRGSSDPVLFDLRAPEEPGDAELRTSVYHRGHMVQSFLLMAAVGESAATEGRRVEVRLDFAATERLVEGEFEMLGDRALALGVNQNGAGGSHTFMVKRGGAAEGFSLDAQLVSEQVNAFRNLLEEATFVPPIVPGQEKARFSTNPAPGAETDPEFHACVRKLADFGRSLYDLLQGRLSGTMHKEVLALATESDRVIQVVRHDANMAFPWGIIYDYPLGAPISDAEPRPVCLGAPLGLGPAPPSKRARGCPHNPGHDVYCIEGFWGVRHRLEQRIGRAVSSDTVVRRPPGHPGVMVAVGIDDENAAILAGQLGAELGSELAPLRKEDDLLDVLWDPERRPAVLVVLGHLETAERAGEPKGPRIALLPKNTWPPPAVVPEEHWLMHPAVSGMAQQRGRWKEDPRTLVLLMACSSAATEVGTLNDLVTTLTPVGVGAVVGTETPVFTRLAARFAAEVTLDLWKNDERTLGEAVQRFNRALIRSGNPLAFAFTCIGNADLTLFR